MAEYGFVGSYQRTRLYVAGARERISDAASVAPPFRGGVQKS
jgi:hypothetical protein